MGLLNVGSTVSPTGTQKPETNAGKAYADRLWDSNSGAASYWKKRVGTKYAADSFTDIHGQKHYYAARTETADDAKAAFEGYEQWIEQQGIQLMEKLGDEMQQHNG